MVLSSNKYVGYDRIRLRLIVYNKQNAGALIMCNLKFARVVCFSLVSNYSLHQTIPSNISLFSCIPGSWQCPLRGGQRCRRILEKSQGNCLHCCPLVRSRLGRAQENVGKCVETGPAGSCVCHRQRYPRALPGARGEGADLQLLNIILLHSIS